MHNTTSPLATAWPMLLGLLKSCWRLGLLVFIALVVFVVLRLLPADPVGMMLPPGATEADRAELNHTLGRDRPMLVQFAIWLSKAVHGDLGTSIASGLPVTERILHALPTTLQLVALGLLGGAILGIGAGLLAFRFRKTPI